MTSCWRPSFYGFSNFIAFLIVLEAAPSDEIIKKEKPWKINEKTKSAKIPHTSPQWSIIYNQWNSLSRLTVFKSVSSNELKDTGKYRLFVKRRKNLCNCNIEFAVEVWSWFRSPEQHNILNLGCDPYTLFQTLLFKFIKKEANSSNIMIEIEIFEKN